MSGVFAKIFVFAFLLAYIVLLIALAQWTIRGWFGAGRKNSEVAEPDLTSSLLRLPTAAVKRPLASEQAPTVS